MSQACSQLGAISAWEAAAGLHHAGHSNAPVKWLSPREGIKWKQIEDIEDDNDGIIDKIIWYYKYI